MNFYAGHIPYRSASQCSLSPAIQFATAAFEAIQRLPAHVKSPKGVQDLNVDL